MARFPDWPDKIDAPAEALKMYRCMARLQHSKEFQKCHVFKGASSSRGVPLVSWENRTTQLPKVVCSFMGLEYRKKTCNTPGCMNPFHYLSSGKTEDSAFQVERVHEPAPPLVVDMGGYVETIGYYIEKDGVGIDNPTFEQLRALIPAEDMADEILRNALVEYQKKHLPLKA